jgi:hypothetical protein
MFCQDVREVVMSDLESVELQSAISLLRTMMPGEELNHLQPTGPAAVYTTLTTIWMMVLQRLGGGLSLKAVVKDAINHGAGFFPDNKRIREGTLSHRDTAFSDARARLRLKTVEHLLQSVSQSLITACSSGEERQVFLLDGTTLTTSPTDDLREAFPPAVNQHGKSVWPTVLMLVAHELRSGCATLPEMGAMYGPDNTSEMALMRPVLARLPKKSIVLADAGFGIFGAVWDTVQAGHSLAFRLSGQRFKSLVKCAELIDQSDTGETSLLTWCPTPRNRATRPDLPASAALTVLLHSIPLSAVAGGDGKRLLLVTTMDLGREAGADLYARRYDVEHDIRDVKVTLNTERIRAHSAEMFRKELLTSLVAYNLVIQFRRAAAARANVRPRALSFTGVWNTFQSFFLKLSPAATVAEWESRYERALLVASRELLPKRPGRSYPRRAHPRRPKTTKFLKSLRKTPPPNST